MAASSEMGGARSASIVASAAYTDPGLRQLRARPSGARPAGPGPHQPAAALDTPAPRTPSTDPEPAPAEETGPPQPPPTTAAWTERGFVTAGCLALVGAVLWLLRLFPAYVNTFRIMTEARVTWSTVINATATAVAGILLLAPGTRRLVGAVALYVEQRREGWLVSDVDSATVTWTSVAAAIPAVAAMTVPRRFAVAVLAGWLTSGLGILAFMFGARAR